MMYRIVTCFLTGILLSGCAVGGKVQLSKAADQIIAQFDQIKNAGQILLLEDTPYQTPAFIFDSGEQGENVMIIGGTHGDEPAGYESALRLIRLLDKNHPKNGKVIIIPLANRLADLNFERRIPVPEGMDIELGNLNRCYPGDPSGLPMQQMAYQIAGLARKHKVDVFVDLHEARYFHLNTPKKSKRKKGLGQTLIYTPNEPSSWLLMNLLDGINATIDNPDELFSGLEEPILHSAAWWAGHELGIASFTFETSRQMSLEKRINYHLELVRIVLEQSGIW